MVSPIPTTSTSNYSEEKSEKNTSLFRFICLIIMSLTIFLLGLIQETYNRLHKLDSIFYMHRCLLSIRWTRKYFLSPTVTDVSKCSRKS